MKMVAAITPNHGPPPHHSHLLRLLNECRNMAHLKQIHAHTLRTTSTTNPHTLFLHSRILHFSSSADIQYAFRFFRQIQTPNSFVCNTLIRACARSSGAHPSRALLLYCAMLSRGVTLPDKFTFPFVLRACAYLFALSEGRQVHAHVVKLGFDSDVYVCNSLIHFYSSCGCFKNADMVFEKMPVRSIVSWNAMIDSLVVAGEFETALRLFQQMQKLFEPDGCTMQSVVNACAGLGDMYRGMWVHAYVMKECDDDVARDVLVNSSLVDMYCKCGSLDMAIQVFERMPKRDVITWNYMILGFAMHGRVVEALKCFDRMVNMESCMPNSITFVGVLSACNHRGMVTKARKFFDMMVNVYNIEPRLEHYGCLVDLFARAGFIDEALNLVTTMPMKPDAVIWRCLLDACSKQQHASIELSEKVAMQILDSGGEGVSSGVYVLLSRVYASASRWNDVGSVRRLMAEEGIAKEPGCSLINIDGITHEFVAADTSHSRSREMYQVLDALNGIRKWLYEPN